MSSELKIGVLHVENKNSKHDDIVPPSESSYTEGNPFVLKLQLIKIQSN